MDASYKMKFFLSIIAILLISACSTDISPLSEEERMKRVHETFKNIFPERELMNKEMSFDEAVSRALEYNLDARLQLQEKNLASAQYAISQINMLPSLNAEVNVSERNNNKGSSSEEIGTGTQNLNYSRSSEDRTITARLNMTYSILDYGLNYAQAQQDANRVQIYHEKRRSIIHNIVSDVRIAFMRVAVAQDIEKDIAYVKNEAVEALDRAQLIRKNNLSSPIENLTYQRNLIQVIKELNSLQDDLKLSHIELAALLNINFGDKFKLQKLNIDENNISSIISDLDKLENYALINRPELAEEDYNYRIETLEKKKRLLSLVPFPTHTLSLDYDHNKFLLNNTWINVSGQLAYNLLQPLIWVKQKKESEAKLELITTRRDTLSLVILAQVNIAYLRYLSAAQSFRDSEKLDALEQEISDLVESAVQTETDNEQQLIFSHARALLARIQRDIDYIELNNALTQIVTAIGYDPSPQENGYYDMSHLTKSIARNHQTLIAGTQDIDSDTPPLPPDIPSIKIIKTTEQRPWVVRTGSFITRTQAFTAKRAIKTAIKALPENTQKQNLQEALFVQTNKDSLYKKHYVNFGDIEGYSQKEICGLLSNINLLCNISLASEEKI